VGLLEPKKFALVIQLSFDYVFWNMCVHVYALMYTYDVHVVKYISSRLCFDSSVLTYMLFSYLVRYVFTCMKLLTCLYVSTCLYVLTCMYVLSCMFWHVCCVMCMFWHVYIDM
jgi:hypothetical protein